MKEGYKKTEIGDIPENWEVIKLGSCTDSFAGGTPLRSNEEFYINGSIPWVKSGEVNQRNILSTAEKITEKAVAESSAKIIKPNSVLIALYGATAGNVGMLRIKATSNQAVLAINSNSDFLSNDYLYHFLKQATTQLLNLTQGSGQPNLSKGIIDNLKIPSPPLPEQQKIASILSTVDEKVENIDAQISQTRELKKSLMQQLLTKGIGHSKFKSSELGDIPESWADSTFNDCVKFSGGAQPPRSTFIFESKEEYTRLIQTRDYRTDKYKTYIPASLVRKTCKTDDIMIGRYGPPIFQIFRGLEGAYNVALIKATPDEKILNKDYLFYYISQYEVWSFVENLSQRSGGQTGVDLDKLKKYPLPLPPISEQLRIANVLRTVDEKFESLQSKKETYQQLKKGLMQQLLTGKIRVNLHEPSLI